MSKNKYVLTYFNGRGRGELSRLIFAATKTPFEDKRIGGEDWIKFKPKTPNGQLPVLEVDGKMLPQSMTIARFLSKELGLHGKNKWEEALIEALIDFTTDLHMDWAKAKFEKDENKKKEMTEKLEKETVPKYLDLFTKFMEDNGSDGFMVGSKLTTGDLAVYNTLSMFPKELQKSPKMATFVKKIGDTPLIKEYVAKRPKTDF